MFWSNALSLDIFVFVYGFGCRPCRIWSAWESVGNPDEFGRTMAVPIECRSRWRMAEACNFPRSPKRPYKHVYFFFVVSFLVCKELLYSFQNFFGRECDIRSQTGILEFDGIETRCFCLEDWGSNIVRTEYKEHHDRGVIAFFYSGALVFPITFYKGFMSAFKVWQRVWSWKVPGHIFLCMLLEGFLSVSNTIDSSQFYSSVPTRFQDRSAKNPFRTNRSVNITKYS
jgi:hypothetical protein